MKVLNDVITFYNILYILAATCSFPNFGLMKIYIFNHFLINCFLQYSMLGFSFSVFFEAGRHFVRHWIGEKLVDFENF